MADRYDPKVVVRPVAESQPGEPDDDDDPLVELTRMASGRSPFDAGPGGSPGASGVGESSGDPSRDLESELLNDLQASFAAFQQSVAPSPPPPVTPPRPALVADARLAPQPRIDRPLPTQPLAPPAPPVRNEASEPPAAPAPVPARTPLSVFRSSLPRIDIANLGLRPSMPANPEPPAPPAAIDPPRPVTPRWGGLDEPKAPAAPEPSRFAPPRAAGLARPVPEAPEPAPVEEAEPFVGDLPFAEHEEPAEEFALEDFGTVPGYGDSDQIPPFPEDEMEALVPRRPGRGLMYVAGLLAVVIIGGLGFIMFRASATSNAPPPIIAADKTPTKIVPTDTGATDTDHQNKLIYERVGSGNDATDSNGTHLVTPGKEPITDIPPVPNASNSDGIARVILPAGPGFDAPVDKNAEAADGSSDDSTLGGRKVRTVVVRPDGTIVSSSASSSDGAAADTATADAKSPPPAAGEAKAPPAAKGAAPPATDANGNYSDLPAVSKVGPIENGPTPDKTATGTTPKAATPPKKVAVKAPPPTPAPAPLVPLRAETPRGTDNANAPIVLTPQGTAPALPAPAPAAPPAETSSGGVLVQLSSQRSEADAGSTFRALQSKFPSLLGGREPNVQRADLGTKGIYFRVRVGPFASAAEAQQLCASLKAAGGQCLLAH